MFDACLKSVCVKYYIRSESLDVYTYADPTPPRYMYMHTQMSTLESDF